MTSVLSPPAEAFTSRDSEPNVHPPAIGALAADAVVEKTIIKELGERRGTRMSDAVVMATLHSNGRWPQIDALQTIAMGAATAGEVREGESSWEAFSKSRGLSEPQMRQVGRALNGLHQRHAEKQEGYASGPSFNPDEKRSDRTPETIGTDRVLAERLWALWGGRQSDVLVASSDYLTTVSAEKLKSNIYDDTQHHNVVKAANTPEVAALGALWEIAQRAMDQPAVKAASIPYRDLISSVWGRKFSEDPGEDVKEKRALIGEVTNVIGPILRAGIEAYALEAREEIGRTTGYKPSEADIAAWLDGVFPQPTNRA